MDVPGHERFVKNMVAGATGIDLVILVIAADEGVMPQTREHLDICQLLGTRGGVVALTKADLVDDEWLEMVTEDVKEYLAGTFLEEAPLIPFSSEDGSGEKELLAAIDEEVKSVPQRADAGIFRLPVDRVFTMKGFGTVITGTLISGTISEGDEVQFYPDEARAKIRGLQIHGEKNPESSTGMRTALNLQGVEKTQVHRGETMARPGTLLPTYLIDTKIHLLSSAPRPLKNRERVRLHLYTSEIMTRVALLEADFLKPGDEAMVQLRLESPAVALPGDRFVIRSYSPITTIGGGVVLDPVPVKHRRMRKPVIEMLARLDTQDHIARLQVHLDQASTFGAPMDQLAVRSGVLVDDVSNTLTELEKGGKAVLTGAGGGALAYSSQSYEELQKKLVKTLTAYHKGNPLKTGMGREELRMKLARDFPERPFKMLLAALEEMEEIELEKDTVRLKAHEATLTPQQEALSGKVMEILAKDGLSPPFVQDLAEELSARPDELKALLGLLAQRGDVVRIKDDYFIHPDEHESLMKKVLDYFGENSEMAMANFREITGITRKWMIPLLEYMDRTQVTMRRGDVRIKRGS